MSGHPGTRRHASATQTQWQTENPVQKPAQEQAQSQHARCGANRLAAALIAAMVGAGMTSCKDAAPPPKPPSPMPSAASSGASPAGGATVAPSAPAAPAAPGAPGAPAAAGSIEGTLSSGTSDPTRIDIAGLTMPKPVAWVWQRPAMQFRTLQYEVPSHGGASPAAELIFSVFPSGGAGPLNANIDRWIGQFRGGTPEEVVMHRGEIEIDGMRVTRIDLRGAYMGMGAAAPRPQTMQFGAIVETPDANVFIRLLGAEATVEENRAEFDAMIAGIKRAPAPK